MQHSVQLSETVPELAYQAMQPRTLADLFRPCAHAGVASSLGACLLSLFAWLLHSWRLLTFVTSAILALAVSFTVPVLQESPRWLLNIGRKVMLRLLYLPSDDKDGIPHELAT